MKKTIVFTLCAAVLCACLCGCGNQNQGRDDLTVETPIVPEMTPMVSPMVTPVASPDPDDGIVNDEDGIIEDENNAGERAKGSKSNGKTAVSPSPKASAEP